MVTINLAALNKTRKPTAKQQLNAPAKTLVQRATPNVAASKATTTPTTSIPKPVATTPPVKPTPDSKPSSPVNSAPVSPSAPSAQPSDDTADPQLVIAFAESLQKLETLIAADNPIRDATMEMIQRCQDTPHLKQFLYENEDAFGICLRAMRKLHSQRTEKRGAYRQKQQVKTENVNTFLTDLADLKI